MIHTQLYLNTSREEKEIMKMLPVKKKKKREFGKDQINYETLLHMFIMILELEKMASALI